MRPANGGEFQGKKDFEFVCGQKLAESGRIVHLGQAQGGSYAVKGKQAIGGAKLLKQGMTFAQELRASGRTEIGPTQHATFTSSVILINNITSVMLYAPLANCQLNSNYCGNRSEGLPRCA